MEASNDTLTLYYETYFRNMSQLQEIDHVPEEIILLNCDFSPENDFFQSLGIIIMENCMAISFNVFPLLYPNCLSIIKNLKMKEKLTETERININMATRIILCLNGEISTAFTIRKRLIEEGILNEFHEEMRFVELICIKFKKSSVAWAYKQFLFKKMVEKDHDYKSICFFWQNEVSFIEKHLVKHPRNYYAWSHRLTLLKELFDNMKEGEVIDLLNSELSQVKKYCEKNVHEYSAYHYLQFLIRKLLDKKYIDINEEKAWSIQLITIYEECYEENNDKYSQNLFSLKKHMDFLKKL